MNMKIKANRIYLFLFCCFALSILIHSRDIVIKSNYRIISDTNNIKPSIKKDFYYLDKKLSVDINFEKCDTEEPYFGKVSISIDNKEIYRDEDIYEYLDSILLMNHKNHFFIFCLYRDRPDPNCWHIFNLNQFEFIKDTLINAGVGVNFSDLDNDGFIEFGGLLPYYESYCLSCDSVFYISNRIYEISDGIRLDSSFSRAENIKEYGFHIDFSIGKHVIPSKR